MSLPLDRYAKTRLTEIRWLFERGELESQSSSPRNSLVSIGLLFTAAEQLIFLLANLYKLAMSPKQVAENWAKKAEEIDKKTGGSPAIGSLSDLLYIAALRNGSLHSGQKHYKSEVQNARVVVRDFLSKVVTDFFAQDIWALSVTELVQSDWVKSRLANAESCLLNGDRDYAILEASAAISLCTHAAAKRLGDITHSEHISVQELDKLFPSEHFDQSLRTYVQGLESEIQGLRKTQRRTILLGLCDAASVQRYFSMRLTVTGPAWLTKANPPEGDDPNPLYMGVSIPNELTLDDAEFLVTFAMNLALELEALEVDLEDPRGHGYTDMKNATTVKRDLPLYKAQVEAEKKRAAERALKESQGAVDPKDGTPS